VFGFTGSDMLAAVLAVIGISSLGLLLSAAAMRYRVRTGG